MRRWIFSYSYPLAVALFPVLSLYVHNLHQLRMREAFWTIAGVCILALLMLAGTHKLVRDANKAAILTSAFFLLMFSFGHVIRSVSYLLAAVGLLEQGQYLVRGEFADTAWLMAWAVLFILVAVTLWKYPRDLNSASRIMSIVTWVALLTVLGQWMLREFRQPSGKIETFIANWKTSSLDMDIQTGSAGADPLPDIYYIILDGLGREDVLKSYYQLDLTEFRSELEDYGFYIADQSFSNYAWTELSLTSALNFSYLDELKDLGLETSDTTPLEVMVDHNRLFDMLRARDYQIITFADEYELTDVTNADVYLSPQRWVLNGFQNELLNTTPLPILSRIASLRSPFDIHREHLLYMFENLAFTSRSERPRFILAHFLAPHPPFVFGQHGERIATEGNFTFNYIDKINDKAGQEHFIRGYREQASFMTTRLLPELEKIIHNSQRPVIIVIQGDHGPGLYLDWLSAENTDHQERMAIFNAFYFYDKNYKLLTPDISPVNSFRVILNQYFDVQLPLLENRSYFTKVYHPYDFIDVTNDLQDN